jgi:antitoxin CptB
MKMNIKINKTKWKCRRGLRELDLLFRRYSDKHLTSLSADDFKMFNSILDLEDQPLYDFIFKNDSLNNPAQEDFILKNLKNFQD